MNAVRSLKETDLYRPLKSWLEKQGYTVRGEVGRCDLAASKNDELIAVELKTRPSLALLAQAAERQEYADAVYVALPAAGDRRGPSASRDFRRLLGRLGIGLILVTFLKTKTKVEILMHPRSAAGEQAETRLKSTAARTADSGGRKSTGADTHSGGTNMVTEEEGVSPAALPPRRRPKKKAVLLREIAGRDMDLTLGGLPGGGLRITAYRQRALRLAAWLKELGEASPAALVSFGAPADAGVILNKNLYGWFERVRRGVYRLHSCGNEALHTVPDLAALYRQELAEKLKSGSPS